MQVAGEADVFVAVGTTLQVYPVAGAVDIARSAGAKVIIVNAEPTPYDDVADAVLPGSISEILPAILGSARVSRSDGPKRLRTEVRLESFHRLPIAESERVVGTDDDLRFAETLHQEADRVRLEHELVVVEARAIVAGIPAATPWPSENCSRRAPGAASGSTSCRRRG